MANSRSRLWPDSGDELILGGALLDSDEAVLSWRRWHESADYDNLDFTHQRLLPLLHENLRRHGVSHPILDRYRAAARRFWAQNQVLYRHAAIELGSLNELNVRALFLKGVPLSLEYYAKPRLRPMSDIDILIDRTNVPAASKYFLDRGWVCIDEFIDNLDSLDQIIEVRHGFNLRGTEGQEIDLHWHIFQTSYADPQHFWSNATTFHLNGYEAFTLCPTDHLLHACSQAAGWNIVRPIRWIPDAKAIITKSEIDWDRLVENSSRFDLAEPVHDALTVLRDFLGLEIPNATLAELKSIPTRFTSRVDYRLSARRPMPIIGRPLQRYFRYLRIGKSLGLTFSQYMQQLWGVSSLYKLIVLGTKRVWSSAMGSTKK